MSRYGLLLFIIILVASLSSCSTSKVPRETMFVYDEDTDDTNKISENEDEDPEAEKEIKKESNMLYIVRTNTKGTMYGNKCAEEVTRNMGFRFLVVPPEQAEPNFQVRNLFVKFQLMLKNGPWWRYTLNRRLKRCRDLTRDYMG